MSLDSFTHTFVPAENTSKKPLLLLHRTGVSEDALIPWAKKLSPGAAVLAVRGRVLEDGKPRFFRRLGQAQFDINDLDVQTDILGRFVEAAREQYMLDAPIAVGHSNGANIAWSLMLKQPDTLSASVLLRPLMPIEPAKVSAMHKFPVFILSGSEDRVATPEAATALPALLRTAGATVSHVFLRAEHDLVPADLELARTWLRCHFDSD